MKELQEIIKMGRSYGPSWELEADELQHLAVKAEELLCNMNGDTNTIEITVKQFSQLVAAWFEVNYSGEGATGCLDDDTEYELSEALRGMSQQELTRILDKHLR